MWFLMLGKEVVDINEALNCQNEMEIRQVLKAQSKIEWLVRNSNRNGMTDLNTDVR